MNKVMWGFNFQRLSGIWNFCLNWLFKNHKTLVFVYHRIVVLFLKSSSQFLVEWNEMLTIISYPSKALTAHCCIALFYAWLDTFFIRISSRKRSFLWGSFFFNGCFVWIFWRWKECRRECISSWIWWKVSVWHRLFKRFDVYWNFGFWMEFAFFIRLNKMTFCPTA